MERESKNDEIKSDVYIMDMVGMSGGFVMLAVFFLIEFLLSIYFTVTAYAPFQYNKIILVSGVLYALFMFMLISSLNSRREMVELLISGSVADGVVANKKEYRTGKGSGSLAYTYIYKYEVTDSDGSKRIIHGTMDKRFDGRLSVGDAIKVRYSPQKIKFCFEEMEGETIDTFLSYRIYIITAIIGIIAAVALIYGFAFSFSIDFKSIIFNFKNVISSIYNEIFSHGIEKKRAELFMIAEGLGILLFGFFALLSPAAMAAKKYKKYAGKQRI